MTLSSLGQRPWHWLAVLLPTLLVLVLRWDAGPGRDVEDYAHYVLHARNIVEGRPYADIGCLPSRYTHFACPRLQPPGLPVTLAALFATVGEHRLTTALLMLAWSLGSREGELIEVLLERRAG